MAFQLLIWNREVNLFCKAFRLIMLQAICTMGFQQTNYVVPTSKPCPNRVFPLQCSIFLTFLIGAHAFILLNLIIPI